MLADVDLPAGTYTALTLTIGSGAYLLLARIVIGDEEPTEHQCQLTDGAGRRFAWGRMVSSDGADVLTMELTTVVSHAPGTVALVITTEYEGARLYAGRGTQLQTIQLS